jgi:predicted metal-binding transcription factor (methanogenesis marker protein 9)
MGIPGNFLRDNSFMKPQQDKDDTIKLHDEYLELQKRIAKEKIHDTKSPENTKIIMMVKEIKSELNRRGYFR